MNATLFPELVVNGEVVARALIAAEAQNHAAPKGKPGIAWRKAANAMAVRTLLLQEARRRGLQPDAAEIAPGRHETEEEALVRCLVESAVPAAVPTEQDVQAEWARDPGRFRAPPLWEARHILCACDPRDEVKAAQAKTRAIALTEQARRDPNGFAALAAAESDCGSRNSGGALGQIGPGDTEPPFEAALRRLTEGQITSEPVLTKHGWHVIQLTALAEGSVLPFEAVRQKIADALEKAVWTRNAREFVAGLIGAAEISGADLRPV